VITTGVLGVVTCAIAVWTTRMNVKTAREQRVQQRLAEAYLELLRLVEQEGSWVRQRIENLEDRALDPYGYATSPMVSRQIPSPESTDAVTMTAILAAFGSDDVRQRHLEWRSAVTAIEREWDSLQWDWTENYDPEHQVTEDELREMTKAKPREMATRQALAEAIRAELNETALPGRRRWLRRR
jgi:hypothetical protein